MSEADIRDLVGQGLTQTEIAERLGVSQSRVSRVLASGRSASRRRGAALRAVDEVAKSLGEMDPDTLARLEAARALARKLDWAGEASTGSAALAAASVARELRALLDELRQVSGFDQLREALLAGSD